MHNWSLLLLACLAVFQPIASFSERNVVHGRELCSDRRDQSVQRDTRLSLYGVRAKPTEQRQLSYRGESHEVRDSRRNEVRDGGYYRDRRVVENQARDTARDDSSRLAREDRRLSRERLSTERDSRRFATKNLENRNGLREISAERFRSVRDGLYDERKSRDRRSNEERMSRLRDVTRRETRNDEQRRDMQRSNERRQSRSVLEREQNSEIRLGRTNRDEVRMSQVTLRNERRIIRQREDLPSKRLSERRSVNRFVTRDDERRSLHYNDNAVRNRMSLNMRESSRLNRRETRDVRDREDVRRDFRRSTEAIENRQRNENRAIRTDERFGRRIVRERSDEQEVRDSRIQTRSRRDASLDRRSESRRDVRNTERLNRQSALSRSDERANNMATRNIRQSNLRQESRPDSMRREALSRLEGSRRINIRESRGSESRDQRSDVQRSFNNRVEIRNKREDVSRFRNVDATRNYEISKNMETTTVAENWPYFFYTLQGIYVCSILVQLFGYHGGEKQKIRSFNFWPSPKMMKVD